MKRLRFHDEISRLRSRDDAIRFLASVADYSYEGLRTRRLGMPLVKSYLVETVPCQDGNRQDPELCFRGSGLRLEPMDDALYRVATEDRGCFALAEEITSRIIAIYTAEESRVADRLLRNAVASTPRLDHAWFSGTYLTTFWKALIPTISGRSAVRMRFQHEDLFGYGERVPTEGHEDGGLWDEISSEEPPLERCASSIEITLRAADLMEALPTVSLSLKPMNAMGVLRIPSVVYPGGNELYHDGKITNRTSNYQDHRLKVAGVASQYTDVTCNLETIAWTSTESVPMQADSGIKVQATPVLIEFSDPLEPDTFRTFVARTFEEGSRPFRLWGTPIWLGARKAHVYGLDLHLFQKFMMELTPEYIELFLPKGTCGNTLHRLVTNLQRYVSPRLSVWVGDQPYEDLIREVLEGGRADD